MLSQEKINKIRELRKTMTQCEVARELGISEQTVKKYQTEESLYLYRNRERMRRNRMRSNPELLGRHREYMRNYRRARWKNDPEFRGRCIEHMNGWQNRNREEYLAGCRRRARLRREKERRV